MSETLVYLYGFVPFGADAPPAALTGMEGGPVRLVSVGPFSAVLTEVAASNYQEGALETRLGDLDWVGQRGVEHEKVVTWFSDHATIVPSRLFTLFSSEAALLVDARARADVVTERLERFADLREWDLKVSYDAATLIRRIAEVSDRAASLDAEIAAAAPGRRYLLERRREELARAEAPAAARRLAAELLDGLRASAHRVIELGLPDNRDGMPVVLDAALLVSSDRVDEFRRKAAERDVELTEMGVRPALTGPWAPYRFVSDDDDD